MICLAVKKNKKKDRDEKEKQNILFDVLFGLKEIC